MPMSKVPQPMKGRSAMGPSVSFSSTLRLFGPERLKPVMASVTSRTATPSPMWSWNQRMCHSRR